MIPSTGMYKQANRARENNDSDWVIVVRIGADQIDHLFALTPQDAFAMAMGVLNAINAGGLK